MAAPVQRLFCSRWFHLIHLSVSHPDRGRLARARFEHEDFATRPLIILVLLDRVSIVYLSRSEEQGDGLIHTRCTRDSAGARVSPGELKLAVLLLPDGVYVSPIPFVWARVIPFPWRDGNRKTNAPGASLSTKQHSRQMPKFEGEKPECSALSVYQMGSLVQQTTVDVHDFRANPGCGCERSADHYINKLR